jgi:hypothetical protein
MTYDEGKSWYRFLDNLKTSQERQAIKRAAGELGHSDPPKHQSELRSSADRPQEETSGRKGVRLAANGESKGTSQGGARLHWFDNQDEGGRDVRVLFEIDNQVGEKGVGNG